MTKKIHFITQAKGGSGKSVLAFMLAEKYKEAVILDLDDATTTTLKQLAYRKPIRVSFLDPTTKRIDRGAFNGLFESVIEAPKELFIADLGASVAEQLPKYFSMNGVDVIMDILQKSDIQLQLVCVVGGGNRSEEHTSELQSLTNIVCRLLLEKKKNRLSQSARSISSLFGTLYLISFAWFVVGDWS